MKICQLKNYNIQVVFTVTIYLLFQDSSIENAHYACHAFGLFQLDTGTTWDPLSSNGFTLQHTPYMQRKRINAHQFPSDHYFYLPIFPTVREHTQWHWGIHGHSQ